MYHSISVSLSALLLRLFNFWEIHTIPIVNLICHYFLVKPVSLHMYIRGESYLFQKLWDQGCISMRSLRDGMTFGRGCISMRSLRAGMTFCAGMTFGVSKSPQRDSFSATIRWISTYGRNQYDFSDCWDYLNNDVFFWWSFYAPVWFLMFLKYVTIIIFQQCFWIQRWALRDNIIW